MIMRLMSRPGPFGIKEKGSDWIAGPIGARNRRRPLAFLGCSVRQPGGESAREADYLGREPSCLAPVEAVTRAGEDDEPCLRHTSGGAAAGQLERVVLVGVALDDEGGDVDAGQVGAQVDCGIGVEGGQEDLEGQVCHLEPGSGVQQRGNGVARAEEIFCGAGLYRRSGLPPRSSWFTDDSGAIPPGLPGPWRRAGALGVLSASPAIRPSACAAR